MSNLATKSKFYLNQHELKKLDADAKKLEMTRSAYVRHLLHTVLPIPFPKTDLSGMISELKEHGRVINQLAVQSHKYAILDLTKLQTQMDLIQDVMDRFMGIYVERKALAEKFQSKYDHLPHGEKHEIVIRMSAEDKQLLNRYAKEARITQSAYLGFLIYGIRPTEKPSSDFFAVMHELGSIGSNLASIWLCASTHEHPDEELFHQFSLWQQDTSAAMIYLI